MIRYLNPVVLQVLQGVIITVLATIYGSHVLPSASRECELSTRWQQLFGAKDERAIRAIQEAFQCCGFRTVKDMAWPFPPTAVQCSSKFDRSLACQVPWTNALQRSAAVNFGAMVAVAVMQVSEKTCPCVLTQWSALNTEIQIIIIILARRYGGKTSSSSWTRLWWPQQDGSERTTSRPLLTRQEAQVEEVDEEVGPGGPDDPRYGTLETNSGPDPTNLPSEMQSPQNERRELPEVS